jgi:hypothetical protein
MRKPLPEVPVRGYPPGSTIMGLTRAVMSGRVDGCVTAVWEAALGYKLQVERGTPRDGLNVGPPA